MSAVQSTVAPVPVSDTPEQWADVPGFADYQVSDWGRVRSRRHRNGLPAPDWRVLNPAKNARGYPQVCLRRADGPARWVEVHKLVLEVFAGPCPAGHVCRHLDGDPGNNRLGNLAYGTQADNCRDKDRHGTAQRGDSHPLAHVTADQVAAMRQQYQSLVGPLVRGFATATGLSESQVRNILARRSWKHLT